MTRPPPTRDGALAALRAAAATYGIDPDDLSPSAYRRFRVRHGSDLLPSHLAVAVLFGGWARACEQAATPRFVADDVEEVTRRSLYGERHHVERQQPGR